MLSTIFLNRIILFIAAEMALEQAGLISLRMINQYRKDNLHPKYVSLKLASFTANLSQAIHGSTLTKKQSIAKKYQ